MIISKSTLFRFFKFFTLALILGGCAAPRVFQKDKLVYPPESWPAADCNPKLEPDKILRVDVDLAKEYLSNGQPLYIGKETKNWVLIKRNVPVPAWKVWGGYQKTRDGVNLREMEEIGRTAPPDAANPDSAGKRVFIGLGHCDGLPGQSCLDPLVQDALFVAVKETYQSSAEIPPQARPKCEEKNPVTNKCVKMSWGDPGFEGYWWEFNLYLDKDLLPGSPTHNDLPCWTKIACAGDIIVDGGKRRQAMMDEYLRTGICPVNAASQVSNFQTSLDGKSSFDFEVEARALALTPVPTPAASQGKSLKLGTFRLSNRFNYEWWTPACKPAIYLYPQTPIALSLKVEPHGELTKTIPEHGQKGWEITAYPNGAIFPDPSFLHPSPTAYPYLFYEARLKQVKAPRQGWVLAQSELPLFFNQILPRLGLNAKESLDFTNYWLKKLSQSPYYFIGLIPRDELDQLEKIVFSSPPDNFIRVRFFFEELRFPLSVEPPLLPPLPSRTGFIAVDWGGLLANGNCQDNQASDQKVE